MRLEKTLLKGGRNLELEQTFMRLVLVVVAFVYGITVISWGVFEEGKLDKVVALGYLYIVVSVISILHAY